MNDKSKLKKIIIIISINVFCLIAFIVCMSLATSLVTPLRSQQAARAWAGQSGDRFAQVSVFFPESAMFEVENMRSIHTDIDQALLNASIESTAQQSVYVEAWSALGEVTLLCNRGTPVTAQVIGVGGDFFHFHPLRLRSGNYLSPNDVMKDRILLDEELAWRLFGAVDLAGMEVLVRGGSSIGAGGATGTRIFTIAGVISRESDFASSRAYTGGAGLFMPFEMLSEVSDGELLITCYEIVMPDPITNFAFNTMTDAFTGYSAHIVENSARFSLSKSFSAIRAFGQRSILTDTIAFPYWENAARYAEDWLALLLVLAMLFAVYPVVCGVYYGVLAIRFGFRQIKKAIIRLIDKRDKRQYEKYLIEHSTEHHIYDVDDIIQEVKNDLL